ncbi:Protein of unknown function [Paenibacillaceae bacterium GAS479]|nr:Protein of unknown function [Paenibacillaceae bacterium GAS479]
MICWDILLLIARMFMSVLTVPLKEVSFMPHWLGWLVVVSLPIIAAAALAAVPIRAHAEGQRNHGDDNIVLNIRTLFGLVKFKWEVPMMKLGGSGLKVKELSELDSGSLLHTGARKDEEIGFSKINLFLQHGWNLLKQTDHLTALVRKTMGKVKITRWEWKTTVGTGDAMWTAMATGMVWSFKTSALGVLSQLVRLQGKPIMGVQPEYRVACLETRFNCIAEISLGNAILAGLQLLVRMMRTKGGVRLWQNILFRA